jgi:valyl-tRNA synthetase
MNLKNFNPKKPARFEKIDSLFLKKLSLVIKKSEEFFEDYEYSKARQEAEKFFWHVFCDNYLEIIKNRIYNSKGDKKQSAQYTLYISLLTILKLFAPITPFITEEIYQNYFKKYEKEKSIHLSSWPEIKIMEKAKASKQVDLFIDLLAKIRQEKTKAKKAMNSPIILSIPKKTQNQLKQMIDDFKAVTHSKEIKTGKFKIKFI